MNREDKLYAQEFGHIPNNQLDRIAHILGKWKDNEKFNKIIELKAKKIKSIKFSKLKFIMWKVIRPSARPRVNSVGGFMHMYVPRAKEEGNWFSEYAKENNLPFINTPCYLYLTIYEKTPASFSIKNKVLAELGFIRPWKRTGDYDNYAKGVTDAIQHGMLSDDCLVIEGSQKLYYSIKPHAIVEIHYMNTFPEY